MALIYKFWQASFNEAWYQLSREEQNQRLAQVGAALEQVGGKAVVLCESGWSNEQWQAFGVEEFPDIEAVQKHTKLLNELNWNRYMTGVSSLGTKFEM
jgi:hypothetical protein